MDEEDPEDIYCEIDCFAPRSKDPVPCDGISVEYYDIKSDPWQMKNTAKELPSAKLSMLKHQLNQMRACQGQNGCWPSQ